MTSTFILQEIWRSTFNIGRVGTMKNYFVSTRRPSASYGQVVSTSGVLDGRNVSAGTVTARERYRSVLPGAFVCLLLSDVVL